MRKQIISLVVCGVLFCVTGYQAGKLSAQTQAFNFKLMMVEVPTNDASALTSFYDAIIGLTEDFNFAENVSGGAASYHLPISTDGHFLQVNEPKVEDNGIIFWFAVSDLDRVLANVESHGGTVLTPEPFDVPISADELETFTTIYAEAHGENPPATDLLGRVAFVADPSGNELALMELHEVAHPAFNFGTFAEPLSADQVAIHLAAIEAGENFSSTVKKFDSYR